MSAFKKVFTDLINADGDFNKLSKDVTKQMLKVFVKEVSPYFLVSDSYFYVPAYFTPEALAEFAKKFPNIKLDGLENKVMLISNWSLELKRTDSQAVFTSYGGVEVRLVVHSFKPQLNEALHPTRWPTNLYRDDEFKTTIQHFRHRSVQQSLANHKFNDQPLAGKGEPIIHGKDDWHFKEGSTRVASLAGAARKPAAAPSAAAKAKGGASAKKSGKAAVKKVPKAAASKAISKIAAASAIAKTKKTPAGAKGSKSMPTPVGKKSAGTAGGMTMKTFKQFIKQSAAKKGAMVTGKKSTGKKSAAKK